MAPQPGACAGSSDELSNRRSQPLAGGLSQDQELPAGRKEGPLKTILFRTLPFQSFCCEFQNPDVKVNLINH